MKPFFHSITFLPFKWHMCACVGWCVRLPEGLVSPCLPLSPLVSHCLPTCVPVLDAVSAFPRVFLASPCLPTCVPVLDGVSLPEPLVSLCLPLSPHMCACVGWCVRLPEGLVSPCLPLSALVSPCLPLSPLVSPCLPLSPLVSHVPVLDGVSAFPRVLSPLVFPCPLVFLLVSLCWVVCPPSRGSCLPLSPLVCPCLPSSPLVSPCPPLCPCLVPFVSHLLRVVSFCICLWCLGHIECAVARRLGSFGFWDVSALRISHCVQPGRVQNMPEQTKLVVLSILVQTTFDRM